MVETSFSELRSKLKQFCDRATADREPIRVRRRDGEDVVLLAADEYQALHETAHLLASPHNAERLLEALVRARRGQDTPQTVEELRAAVGL
jgi:antitoxin YefM